MYHFGGRWVRIQAQTENVSLIFFWADFSTFSYLNCFSHNLGGVHKPCGPSKTRGRDCLAAYGINQFDVKGGGPQTPKNFWELLIKSIDPPNKDTSINFTPSLILEAQYVLVSFPLHTIV